MVRESKTPQREISLQPDDNSDTWLARPQPQRNGSNNTGDHSALVAPQRPLAISGRERGTPADTPTRMPQKSATNQGALQLYTRLSLSNENLLVLVDETSMSRENTSRPSGERNAADAGISAVPWKFYGYRPLSRTVLDRQSSRASRSASLPQSSQSSPSESPRVWLRDCMPNVTDASSSSILQTGAVATASDASLPINKDLPDLGQEKQNALVPALTKVVRSPSTMVFNGRLYVCFPNNRTPCTFSIKLEMQILLSSSNDCGWQHLRIPGLPRHRDSDVAGTMDFSFPVGVEFDSTGLLAFSISGQGRLRASFSLQEEFSLHLRPKAELRHLERWDSNVQIYSTPSYTRRLGIKIEHNITFSLRNFGDHHLARRLSFSLLLQNGSQHDCVHKLESGESIIRLKDRRVSITEDPCTARIHVECNAKDLTNRFTLRFKCYYPQGTTSTLPTPILLPQVGSVLSEKIWVAKPAMPLQMRAPALNFPSTWAMKEKIVGGREHYCFERMPVPFHFPEALVNTAASKLPTIVLSELHPVNFCGIGSRNPALLETSHPYDLIPSLHLAVDVYSEKHVECELKFSLEVGVKQTLVTIDAGAWEAKYASINSRTCARGSGHWWEEHFLRHLHKEPWMKSGDRLDVTICFCLRSPPGDLARGKRDGMKIRCELPRIVDKTLLGAVLTCSDAGAVMYVDGSDDTDNQELCFSDECGGRTRRLPTLNRDYRLWLQYKIPHPAGKSSKERRKLATKTEKIRFNGGIPFQPRAIRFEDDAGDSTTSNEPDSEDSLTSSSWYASCGASPQRPRGARDDLASPILDQCGTDHNIERLVHPEIDRQSPDHTPDRGSEESKEPETHCPSASARKESHINENRDSTSKIEKAELITGKLSNWDELGSWYTGSSTRSDDASVKSPPKDMASDGSPSSGDDSSDTSPPSDNTSMKPFSDTTVTEDSEGESDLESHPDDAIDINDFLDQSLFQLINLLRSSWMQHLIRFLVLECVVFLVLTLGTRGIGGTTFSDHRPAARLEEQMKVQVQRENELLVGYEDVERESLVVGWGEMPAYVMSKDEQEMVVKEEDTSKTMVVPEGGKGVGVMAEMARDPNKRVLEGGGEEVLRKGEESSSMKEPARIRALKEVWVQAQDFDRERNGSGNVKKRSLRDQIDLALGWRPVSGTEASGGRTV